MSETAELEAYGDTAYWQDQGTGDSTFMRRQDETFNINSPKQLGVILFEKMKMPGGKKTKTGYSTAADVLEQSGSGLSGRSRYSGVPSAYQIKIYLCGWTGVCYMRRRWTESTVPLIRRLQLPDGSAVQSRICRISRCVWNLDV